MKNQSVTRQATSSLGYIMDCYIMPAFLIFITIIMNIICLLAWLSVYAQTGSIEDAVMATIANALAMALNIPRLVGWVRVQRGIITRIEDDIF